MVNFEQLEEELNILVPATGSWPELISCIAKWSGLAGLKYMGSVGPLPNSLHLWGGAEEEGSLLSCLVLEELWPYDPSLDLANPYRRFLVVGEQTVMRDEDVTGLS